jgi:hypothetical protein
VTNGREQIVIMQHIARLIGCAADLERAVAYEDGTYIRAQLSAIETYRSQVLAMIYDWKPELLSASVSPSVETPVASTRARGEA